MVEHSNVLVSAIVAMDENGLIGAKNSLPWHLPADLKHFQKITTGHPVIMGRKTYDSIGRPLPNRHNIILTRSTTFKANGCTVVKELDEALKAALPAKEIFILGGAQIFADALPIIQRIYLTRIHHRFEGDIFFPKLITTEWQETNLDKHFADNQNPYDYTFSILERR